MMSDDNFSSGRRTRASGEVLNYLLQEFETNQNPSPEQRKDISDKTNMSEKAVRIWFQNRRAKVRKSERKGRSAHSGSIDSSRSNSVSVLDRSNYANFDVNENYCFIDCTSLSVGSWQRVKSGFHDEKSLKEDLANLSPFTLNKVMQNFDLLVIVSKKNLEINYFFSAMSDNSRILFRIFYPIASILSCSLLDNNIDKECNEVRVSLSHQPKFSVNFFNGVNSSSNQWSICSDFSEGQQVSSAHSEGGTAIPHVLVGSKDSICFLNDFILEKNQQHQMNYMINDPINGEFNDPNGDTDMNDVNFEVQENNPKVTYFANPGAGQDASDNDVNEDFKYDGGTLAPVWTADNELKANGLSPLDHFTDSQTNVNQERGSQKKSEIANFNYTEVFTANTPDFVNSSQTPNLVNNTPSNIDIDQDPQPTSQSPHQNYQTISHNQEIFESAPTDQFDFPVVNDYSGSDSNIESPEDNHLERFIDYHSYQ